MLTSDGLGMLPRYTINGERNGDGDGGTLVDVDMEFVKSQNRKVVGICSVQ